MKYLISNLKASLNENDVEIYVEQVRRIPKNEYELIICPSLPFIKDFVFPNCHVGAQNISKFKEGSFTGEVTAKQVASVHCEYVIVGHCERKLHFREDKTDFIAKIKNAFDAGLKVIYCIGETKRDIELNETLHALEKQLGEVLNDFTHEELKNIIIAYEPCYAVGTKQMPEINEIKSTTKFIKNLLYDYYELDFPVIYGGSIDRANILLLRRVKEIDGYMIGNSSLDIKEFERIRELSSN